jgi:predicted RNase H-like nuclease (RuvC/YqgF family)
MEKFVEFIISKGASFCCVIEDGKILSTSEPKEHTILISDIDWSGEATGVVFQDVKYFMIARDENSYKAKKGKVVLVLKKVGTRIYTFQTSNDDESVINHFFETEINKF